MRVAAVQLRSGTSIDDNLPMVAELVKQAAQQGAQYVQTPEMTGIVQSKQAGAVGRDQASGRRCACAADGRACRRVEDLAAYRVPCGES